MIASIIDTHCHLDFDPLKSKLPEFLNRACLVGVKAFVVPGVKPEGWSGIAELATKHPNIIPAYGIHPMYSEFASEEVLERLEKLAITGVAIGEIGLDSTSQIPIELQEMAFRKQLRIAVKLNLPVLIHCRRLFQKTLQIIYEEGAYKVGGIMHAYSGSLEMAHEYIKLGFIISVSGVVTWDGAVKALKIARDLPIESLVFETDAPDLTAERYRGTLNEPAYIIESLKKVANLRGKSIEELAHITTANASRILRLNY